ncbi:MAG: DnaD domain protein [Firmicutes bacterium]|nr:DnaD domain protein [Bacillota bacterium]
MSFKREKVKDYFLLDTNVENMFINEYMISAPGEYVKVYLFALMYADLGEPVTNEMIAKHLGMDHEDVLKAWTYWENMGVIRKKFEGSDSKFDYGVEFVMLKEQLYGTQNKPAAVLDKGISAMMADEDVKSMFSDIEKTVGRILSSTEVRQINSWITDYHATPEIIAYCFEYCAGKKKTGLKYVEAVIKGWTEEGLRTAVDAEKYLSESDKKQFLYRRIFQALGFNRNATEEEKRLMNRWFEEMGFGMDKVLEACGKTSGISSPNINYVNKVLENWYNEGGGDGTGKELTTSDIMNYYERLRETERAAAEVRRNEVFRKIPRIREIEEERNGLNSEISRIIISDVIDKKAATDKIKKQLDSLNTEQAFLLTDNGFELDYMDVQYTCPDCRDTGVLETGERCRCFGEVTKEKIQLLMERTNN